MCRCRWCAASARCWAGCCIRWRAPRRRVVDTNLRAVLSRQVARASGAASRARPSSMWRSPGSTAAGSGMRREDVVRAALNGARRGAGDRRDRQRQRADDPVRAAFLRPGCGGHRADACTRPRPSTTIYTHAARPDGRRLDPRRAASASATWQALEPRRRHQADRRAGCARAACCTCCPTWISAASRSSSCLSTACRPPPCPRCRASRGWAGPRWCRCVSKLTPRGLRDRGAAGLAGLPDRRRRWPTPRS